MSKEQTPYDELAILNDLQHSLEAPIAMAYARARAAAAEHLTEAQRIEALRILAVLCGRARQALRNASLLVKLCQHQPIDLKLMPFRPDDCVSILMRVIEEAIESTGQGRNIASNIDRTSFDRLAQVPVLADLDLLEQVFRALIDNAVRYSYPGSTVVIRGLWTAGRAFSITFTNRGIPISPDDIDSLSEFGWRGRAAKLSSGAGSGIGLWLVDNIVKAHKGHLLVRPTNADGLTEVAVVLPSFERTSA